MSVLSGGKLEASGGALQAKRAASGVETGKRYIALDHPESMSGLPTDSKIRPFGIWDS